MPDVLAHRITFAVEYGVETRVEVGVAVPAPGFKHTCSLCSGVGAGLGVLGGSLLGNQGHFLDPVSCYLAAVGSQLPRVTVDPVDGASVLQWPSI